MGKALKEYAGSRNRQALVALLSPVHRASEKSPFVKELVDSGDVFHPLAWTPHEAYRFLKEVPVLEESGLLVRVPDWWRKRPRPRVSVTIGDKKQSRFGTDTILDFNVELAREKLSQALSFWEELESRAGDRGISFIEGMRLLAGASPDLKEEDAAREEVREWSFVDAGAWLSEVVAGLREPARPHRLLCPPFGNH